MEKRRWSEAKKKDMLTPSLLQLENMIWQKVYCCREWLVSPFYPIGACGYCGQRPKLKLESDEKSTT